MIVVIAILAAIAIVAYRGIQERAQKTETIANINQVNKAVMAYVAEHGTPPLQGVNTYEPEFYPGTSVCIGEGYPDKQCGTVTTENTQPTLENPAFCEALSAHVHCPLQAISGGGRSVTVDQSSAGGPSFEFRNAFYAYQYDPSTSEKWIYNIGYLLIGDTPCEISGAVRNYIENANVTQCSLQTERGTWR